MPLPDQLPTPDLSGQRINVDQFRALTPEKFELLAGYLFDSADTRHKLLRLLLVNVGLVEAVRLAPEHRWHEALRQGYPT